jgi:hypothetical protein
MMGVMRRWLCRWLRWHQAPLVQSFDGASFWGRCQRCGARVYFRRWGWRADA